MCLENLRPPRRGNREFHGTCKAVSLTCRNEIGRRKRRYCTKKRERQKLTRKAEEDEKRTRRMHARDPAIDNRSASSHSSRTAFDGAPITYSFFLSLGR